MAIRKLVIAADDSATQGKVTEGTVTDFLVGALTHPFKAFTGSTNTFIDERTSAQFSAVALGIGVVGGEAWGHKRARSGKQALVPFLR